MLKSLCSLLKFKFSNRPSNIITTRDAYNSLLIKFQQKLAASQILPFIISQQATETQSKTNAIWIFLSPLNLQLIPALVNQMGYRIHHGKDNKVVLYKWLLKDKTDLVPPYSAIYVSCGAVVIDKQHLLMVQQKSGPRQGLFGIPGGRSDFGQFLHTTVQRELFEETAIKSHFQYFLFFRQMQNTVFGANDIYFACMMKPEQQSLQNIRLCQRQLEAYQWVHLSKLQQFARKSVMGTQSQVSKYISQLYKGGYDFSLQKPQNYPNLSTPNTFNLSKDKISRKYMTHKLIKQ